MAKAEATKKTTKRKYTKKKVAKVEAKVEAVEEAKVEAEERERDLVGGKARIEQDRCEAEAVKQP